MVRSRKWVLLAGALYAISLVLPTVVHESERVWLGAQAALFALIIPLYLSLPPGFLLATYYPLLGVTLYAVLRKRAFATGAATALVSTMALWGLCTPSKPSGEVLSVPGGYLSWGFWVWLAAGACLLVASGQNNATRAHEPDIASTFPSGTRRRLARTTVIGLVYASIVLLVGLVWKATTSESALRPTDTERHEVEADKRRMP
jgi:hypothetical protein